MKYLLLVILIPFQLMAQKPVRHYDFVSRKQPGLFVGKFSISPSGTMLLATFNDLDKKAVYELVNTSTGKLISNGPLPAVPQSIAWNDDEKMVAIGYRRAVAVCYDVVTGMKKLFSTAMEGTPAFSKNTQLLATSFSPDLFVFGDERVYRHNLKGMLLDSARVNAYASYDGIWFDLVRNRFLMAEDGAIKLSGYSANDKKLQVITRSLSDGSARILGVDKDGTKFFFVGEQDLYIHDASDGRRITNYRFDKAAAACFTPDGKNLLVFDKQQVSLLNLQGQLVKTSARPGYYSCIGYGLFGKELITAHPDGFDVFNCDQYFFAKETPVVNKPPGVTNPSKPSPPTVESKPVVKEKPWSPSYKIRDFITPFEADSFYLYSKDRALRFFIRYKKGPPGIFSPVSFGYSQFFGLSQDAKYRLVNNYVIDMTDSTARLGSYSRISSLDENPLMIGGQNYLGQISSSAGKTLSWPMNIFNEQFTLTARVIDNVYKGVKGKCLAVTRDDPKNNVNETYYYQLGVGLVRIDSNGKVGFER